MLPDRNIPAPDPELEARIQAEIDAKTKPLGALGRIEEIALRLALAQGTLTPSPRATLLLFAGDHGLVAEGVSAWPSEVTAQMVMNFLGGGAAANVFAASAGAEIVVADAGVAAPLPEDPRLRRLGLAPGTLNAAREPAMPAAHVTAALEFGASLAEEAVASGARVIALGEMGIGNTSSASLVAHALTGIPLGTLAGPGAGLDSAGLSRKLAVLERAADRAPGRHPPFEALGQFGGYEIAAMAGALIGASAARAVTVVDGFIASVAALAALTARPEAAPYCLFAHRSQEPGHAHVLARIPGAPDPLLDLSLRLGEGTGALLALPLIKAAAAMLTGMATFESASISARDGSDAA